MPFFFSSSSSLIPFSTRYSIELIDSFYKKKKIKNSSYTLSSSIRILSKRRLNREREKEEEKVERLSPMDIYIYNE